MAARARSAGSCRVQTRLTRSRLKPINTPPKTRPVSHGFREALSPTSIPPRSRTPPAPPKWALRQAFLLSPIHLHFRLKKYSGLQRELTSSPPVNTSSQGYYRLRQQCRQHGDPEEARQRPSRQVVQARQGEGLPRSCRVQVDPAQQEIWLPREEQGRARSVRCARSRFPFQLELCLFGNADRR